MRSFADQIPGLDMLVVPLGTITADGTKVWALKVPWKYELIGVRTHCASSSGTTPAMTVDVLGAGVSLLAAVVAVHATGFTYTDATLVASPYIAADAELSINVDVTSTTPTYVGVTVLLALRRTN